MRYSVQPTDRIFVKGYGFLTFAENIGKNISKSLSCKYSQKLLEHSKQSSTDALKTVSKRAIQKTAEATGDLIGNQIAIELRKSQKIRNRIIQKQLQMNMIKLPKERNISPDKRQKIIDDLRLIYNVIW